MAVPKTTETRCRDGSVQEGQGIQTLHKQPHPCMFNSAKTFVCTHTTDVSALFLL